MPGKYLLFALTFIAGTLPCFSLLATPLELVEQKIEVIGAIVGDASEHDNVGIVILKDLSNDKSFAVPIGRTFVFQNQLFHLQGIEGRSILISDGVGTVALPYNEGRKTLAEKVVPKANDNEIESTETMVGEITADNETENSDELFLENVKISSPKDNGNLVGLDNTTKRIFKNEINSDEILNQAEEAGMDSEVVNEGE